MSLKFAAWALATAVLSTSVAAQDCESYGVDFQNDGSYFQNISSSAPFTFVSFFEGCQNDTCTNILVDPNGNEYECSDTSLLPSDVNQLSTCEIDKDQMFSGDWAILLLSNNGDADPIAYERDITLSVGLPTTITYTPTIAFDVTSTPVVNSTTISTVINTVTASGQTITDPAVTTTPTVTKTPAIVTSTVTHTFATLSRNKFTLSLQVSTATHTATCSVPPVQSSPDPTCTITPTLVSAAALATVRVDAAGVSVDVQLRRDAAGRVPLDREQRIAERKARRANGGKLQRRAPDSATVTTTDLNTADWQTQTVTITAAATTLLVTSATTYNSTITPPPTTVYSGTTTVSVHTTTLPTSTVTRTHYTLYTTWATYTKTRDVTVTTTYVPSQSAIICALKGGKMV